MAIEAAKLVVTVQEEGIDKTVAGLRSVDKTVTQTGNSTVVAGGKMKTALGGAKASMASMLPGIGAVGLAAAAMGKASIDAASDMSEAQNKVNVVFGNSADDINAFAENAAQSLGLSESAALSATGTFGNLFTSMGMGQRAAADMSTDIVQLAADLGSFNNIGTDEALEKLRAGLVGEIEPLRSLGVNINAVMVQEKALAMGLAATTKELTAADKAQASYALILQQTTNAQGDFVRTADGTANSMKTTQATIDDLKASIGAGLLPVVASLAQQLTTTVGAITSVVGALNALGGSAGGATAAMSAVDDAMVFASGGSTLLIDGVKGVAGWFDSTEQEASTLVPMIFNVAEAMRIASGEGNILEATIATLTTNLAEQRAELEKLHASGAQDYATDLERLANNGREAQVAQNEYSESLGRAAEMAGLANERNTEAMHSLELVGGAAAEAAYGLDQFREATETAWAAQDQLNGMMSTAQGEVSKWESHLSDAENALKILDGEMEENGSLTAEQQKQYDALAWATGRYTGAVEDSEGAVVDAAVAQADFVRIQDELNGKLANGEISAHDYNVEMGKAAGAIDPAAGASYNLSAAQQAVADTIVGVVEKIEGLLVKLGLIPPDKKTDVSAPGAIEAQQQLSDVKLAADRVPSSLTITAHVDLSSAVIALDELRGMTFTQSPPKEGPMAFVPDWSYLFEGLDQAADDYGTQAMERLAGFFTGLDIEGLASGELFREAQQALTNLVDARAIAVQMGLGGEVIAEIERSIAAAQAELSSIGAAMGTPIVQGIAAALESGEMHAALADFREEVTSSLNFDDILGQQESLSDLQIELNTLILAAEELGDVETAARLKEQYAELYAEAVLLNQVIGTEAVQAWIAWQEEVKAAEDAAALMAEQQERLFAAMVSAAQGLAAGGDAAGNFFEGLVADAEAAKAALDLGLLLKFPPEVMEQLGADLTEAELLLSEGTRALQTALLSGLIDEATLQALAEAGGTWFQTLYDQLFGPGALATLEAGWNDISDASLEQLQLLISGMEDGAAGLMDPIVSAVASGALSFEEALGLLSDATGEEVNAILEELQALEVALTVQLAEALLAGTDPSGIEANLAVIEQLLASLADRAVETAAVVKQGLSFGTFDAERAVPALDEISDGIDAIGESARKTTDAVRKLSGALDQTIVDSFIFTRQPGARSPDQYGAILSGVIDRMQESMALNPEAFTDAFLSGIERIQSALQEATLIGQTDAVASLTSQYQEMLRVASVLGVDLAEVLGAELDAAAVSAAATMTTAVARTTGQLPGLAATIPLLTAPMESHVTAGGGVRDTTPVSTVAYLTDDQMRTLARMLAEEVGRASESGTRIGSKAGVRDALAGVN